MKKLTVIALKKIKGGSGCAEYCKSEKRQCQRFKVSNDCEGEYSGCIGNC